MLEVFNLEVSYGEFLAVKGVEFKVNEGELVTIIGTNGAGKSSILKAIMGLVRLRKGEIRFNGKDISRRLPNERAMLGMSLVPEGRKIFPELTVKENLIMGAYLVRDKRKIQSKIERVFKIFPILEERQNQMGKTLSGGEQQMLAIARSLMSMPKLILMDEVSLGLMPIYVEETFHIIKELNEQGVTVLLVEQNAKKALQIADRGYVLETGEIILSDTSKNLIQNPQVKKAYLGGT